MKNSIKCLSAIIVGLGALNARADYSLALGSGSSLPPSIHANSPAQSGKTTFTIAFGGTTIGGSWGSGKLGLVNGTDPGNINLDSWYSAVGNPGFKNSYFQLLSDNNYFTDVHIDAASTLLLNPGTLAAAPNNTLSPNGTYQTASQTTPGAGVYLGNHSYTVVVDWTMAANQTEGDSASIYFKFAATEPTGGQVDAISATAIIDVVAVPEPGQALAGAMLLGCGALVFTGRRWMSKHAAK